MERTKCIGKDCTIDEFFEGSMGSCFQQIGNAVPVLLAQVLARQVKEELL